MKNNKDELIAYLEKRLIKVLKKKEKQKKSQSKQKRLKK